jgi:small multidrug resistance pump
MAYLLLALAIAFEIAGTIALKFTAGFTRLWPSLAVAVGYTASFALLSQVLKTVPVSVAYAIWSGAGTAVVAAIGFTFLGEPVSWLKITGIALVVAGVVALNAGGAH